MIEKLNVRITIQKDCVAVDKYGNHVKFWADYFSCWAYANTFQQEEKDDVVTSDGQGITFHVRFCSELAGITSTGYRVIFHDEIYDIESVDMMNWQRQMIHLKCQKETPPCVIEPVLKIWLPQLCVNLMNIEILPPMQ